MCPNWTHFKEMNRMGKFDLKQLLSQNSLNQEKESSKGDDKEFKVRKININDLVPASEEENFYSITEFKELKESIEMFGIQQNLIVKEIEDGKYKVIAGHRRRLAALELVNEGKEEFEYVPCIVKKDIDNVSESLLLIMTNSTTRVLSDWEKVKQCVETEKLLKEYRKNNKVPGRTRDLVSEILDTSPSNIGRMKAIHNNLNADLKEEFKNNNINISTAYELSGLSNDLQEKALKKLREEETLTLNDVKELKKREEEIKPLPGQITIDENIKDTDFSIKEKEYDEIDTPKEVTNQGKSFEKEEYTEEDKNKEPIQIETKEEIKNDNKKKCKFCEEREAIKSKKSYYELTYGLKGTVGIWSKTKEMDFVNFAYCPLCGKEI